MKRPEFQEHFKEYIDEISDPKNKKVGSSDMAAPLYRMEFRSMNST